MRTKKRNGLAAPAAIILATVCIIGANTAAARIDDLTGQRDIYRNLAINWETEALEAEDQVQELKAQLAEAQQASAESAVHFRYAGEFGCTAYCSEKYEHICGTGDGITASGVPVQAGVTVAADPGIFPFGTALYIEGVGVRYVQDIGAAIQGNKLDVAVDTHENALAWAGYGTHRVWIIEEGAAE